LVPFSKRKGLRAEVSSSVPSILELILIAPSIKKTGFNSSYEESIKVPIEERELLIKMKETGKVLVDTEQIELKLNHLNSFRFPIDNIVHKKKVEQILETAVLYIVKARFDNEELLYNLEREQI
jgi:hypothetical protein